MHRGTSEAHKIRRIFTLSTVRRTAAILSVLLSAISLIWTANWLTSHAWRWSSGAAVVAVAIAVPALFLVSLSFRDQSTRRPINLTLGILALTAVLYVMFPRDPTAF